MTRLPSRAHRTPVFALALLTVLPVAAAHAQGTDSVTVLPGAGVPSTTIGASVTVIESAEIAASAARTLSELLLARVPGLSVRRRGGTEAEGADVRVRGMTVAGKATPMLVVDGIVTDPNQAVSVPGTSAAMSRLDDLTPADIQRVEVLLGPAASALYGLGAGSGVIVVTTRRGQAGPLQLDVASGVALSQVNANFPANYQLTNGTPGQVCNPRSPYSSPAGCVPTTLYSWAPLEQASPFRAGRAASARAALSGTTGGTQLFAGVSAEQAGGVTSDDRQSRLALRASAERALPGHLTMSAQGSYQERDVRVPTRGGRLTAENVIFTGLLGGAYDDSTRGYYSPYYGSGFVRPAETRLAEPSLTSAAGALNIAWRPLAWLTVDALGGQHRSHEQAVRTERYEGSYGTSRQFEGQAMEWRGGTLHLGMEARRVALSRLALATYLAYDDTRTRESHTDSAGSSFGGVSGGTWSLRNAPQRVQDATIRQQVAWGDRLVLNAGARWSVGRGILAPLGREAFRNVDASWRLPALHTGLDLRLRAAAGFSPLVPPGTQQYVPYLPITTVVGYGGGTRPLRSRQGEREGGIDATFGQRARLQLTYFSAQSRDAVIGYGSTPSPTGFFDGPVYADQSTGGVEAVGSAQLLDGPRVGWRTTLTLATLRSRITDATMPLRSASSALAVDYPAQGLWNAGYRWFDANGDGVVARDEVQADGTWSYVGPSVPTIEMGLRNAVTFGRSLTLGAHLDYRGGQYRDNQTETVRCRTSATCQGLQDPTVPLAEQVRWVAVSRGLTQNIEPASFLRLRELVLDWAVPLAAARLVGTERLGVRLVGQNLATWTRYSGVDPEVSDSSPGGWGASNDYFQAPLARRLLVEVRVGAGIGGR